MGRAGQVVGDMPWNVCSITSKVSDFNLFYRGGGMLFPLYTYPDSTDLLAETIRKPNINPQIVANIASNIGLTFTAEKTPVHPELVEGHAAHGSTLRQAQDSPRTREMKDSPRTETTFAPIDLLDYIYAVLHSPTYRETYKEFLKIDFPRVPYPKNVVTFWQLVALGAQLRQTHLLEECSATRMHIGLQSMLINYPIGGDNIISKLKFETDKVYINETQYFENVPEIAWGFYIGGYQPAQKWLKDRKGRALNHEDITHYQKIISTLTKTHALMQAVDKINID